MSTTATDGSPSPIRALSRATPGCLEALAVRDFHCGVVVAQLASVPFGPEARHLHADGRSDVAGPDRVGDGGLPSACRVATGLGTRMGGRRDRKSTRLNSSHVAISYAVVC